jgi:pimeloyl-ACP methyl ester carboxylesterase
VPTVVLVHGAWHGSWVWDTLRTELGTDIEVRTVGLPSAGPRLGSLADDVAAIRSTVAAVNGPVVVVAHSYGGLPVTEGLADMDNVVRIVYLAAFLIDAGMSLAGALGGGMPDWWDVHEKEGYVAALRPEEVFYNDLDVATAKNSAERLTHQALSPFLEPLTAAAWRSIPSSYVLCEKDQAIPLPVQEMMAANATRTTRLSSSHSPFLSVPKELAAVLRSEITSS